jgi:chemotaxis response regulator CheB
MGGIRVIVAESRDGSAGPVGLLRAVLEQEGVEVAGEVFDRSELIQLAADEQPDAVVFAARAPQQELDHLRAVTPRTKVVFVSPILTAAEAEMVEAVVERSDVLASLGPVLVHLCAPGRVNARRAMTEHFDRPDWIDRVRKDPAALRDILSDGSPREPGVEGEKSETPNVTSLQGEARAADSRAERGQPGGSMVVLPDLESEEDVGQTNGTAIRPAARSRWRRPWTWMWPRF